MMQKIIRDEIEIEINERLPILPLKEVIMFPNMIYPLLVGKDTSLKAIQEALLLDKLIFLTAQKDKELDEPEKKDLFRIGVISRILQVVKLPNGYIKMLVEGLLRGRVKRFSPTRDFFEARIVPLMETKEINPRILAGTRHVLSLFKDYIHLNRNIPDEILLTIENMEHPQKVVDFICAHITIALNHKQSLLETVDTEAALYQLAQVLDYEKEILEIERNIEDKVRNRIQKSQRNFYLQEQMRVIREELGDDVEPESELLQLKATILKLKLPTAAEEKALEELGKLEKMPLMSPEATVIRNYLDWLIAVPWTHRTKDTLDLEKAKCILDEDHFGLKEPKERILEYLAVVQLVKKMKGPILCFVGPPGVGKTSLGKSIARAMGRNFVRLSLGGVRDEAEIRGHRRTYIGSMPGRIIQYMKRAKSVNPVFLLDEIDKMSVDFRGDPSSALLEVLDPEQNNTFNDHYLDVDYDLSDIFFITTANVREAIPEPLLDRLEIIKLPGYLEYEKQKIAENFLVPKQTKSHGLDEKKLIFTRSGLQLIQRQYTREAGVRKLEQKIAAVCRKVARQIVMRRTKETYKITGKNLAGFLGVPKFSERPIQTKPIVGTAIGLAWTSFGGEVLQIEVILMKGKGNLILTGNLGEVMQESAKAALSYIRSVAKKWDIPADFTNTHDIHIHVPEGATPKDGPSAGVTMATAILSALTNRPVKQDLAMTGEITLRGRVLAIGGLNEKIMAARRVGIKTVFIPKENEKDLHDLAPELRKGIKIQKMEKLEQIFDEALVVAPEGEDSKERT